MLTLTFDSKINRVFSATQDGCVDQVWGGYIKALLNGNGFGTFNPGDHDLVTQMNMVSLLPKMGVWTRFEEGRSRHSWVIYRKWFWHIWRWWPWPLTPKSLPFVCCPGRMCGISYWSETKSLQKDRLTDRQTDRPTCKAICPLIFERGT